MAGGIINYVPIHGANLISDFKSHFSIFRRTRRSVALAYAFASLFIAFTIFLAFTPSSHSSSPWFTSPSPSASSSYRSHFSSIYNYFFHNSSPSSSSLHPTDTAAGSQNTSTFLPPSLPPPLGKGNQTKDTAEGTNTFQMPPVHNPANNSSNSTPTPTPPSPELSQGTPDFKNQTLDDESGALKENKTATQESRDKVEILKPNQSTIVVPKSKETGNTTPQNDDPTAANGIANKGVVNNNNLTSSLMKKQDNGTAKAKRGVDDLVKSLMNCNLFDGNWVKDDSYPLYKPGSCSAFIDETFNCYRNGRPDDGYYKLKWKPKGCTLPRLNGSHMLELLRGKRLVFVGDSLNRNMWESLICILRNSVKDQKKVYEKSGRHHFRTEASYSFVFQDYKCTVEYFVAPFLVQQWEMTGENGAKKETLRLDLISRSADEYKNADIIVFNTGHWWGHEKTRLGKDYYQEGSHVHRELNALEAFRRAIRTWGRWVDAHVNPKKSLVFFRGNSAVHFRGGRWNSGGKCDHETEPIKNETYLMPYLPKMSVLEEVLRGMKTHVTYLNVTRMTDYRKDGHPSIYRKRHMSDEERRSPLKFQDCSHWCLPGVPDAWNEVLYAELLVKH